MFKRIREGKFRCSDLIEITPLSSCTIIDFLYIPLSTKSLFSKKNLVLILFIINVKVSCRIIVMYSNFWSKKKQHKIMTLSEFKVNYKYKTLRYFFSYKKYKISLVNNDLCKLSINTSYSIWKLIKKTSVLKLYIQDFMCSQICKKN